MGREDATSRNEAALAGRMARHLKPSVPAWDQAAQPLPWWETVSPTQADRHISLESSSDPEISAFSPARETGTGERGWAPMKRILLALAGLAALFLAAGAPSHL